MKFKKLLQSIVASLKASESEKDEAKRKSLIAEAAKKAKEAEDEMGEADVLGMEAFKRKEGESDGDHKKRLGALAKKLQAEMEAYESEDEDESESTEADEDIVDGKKESEDEDEDGESGAAGSSINAKGKAAHMLLGKKDMEAARAAVRHALREAKVPAGLYTDEDINDLAKLSYAAAKRQIARESRQRKLTTKAVAESLRMPSTFVERGAGADEEEGEGENLNASLVESFRTVRRS